MLGEARECASNDEFGEIVFWGGYISIGVEARGEPHAAPKLVMRGKPIATPARPQCKAKQDGDLGFFPKLLANQQQPAGV